MRTIPLLQLATLSALLACSEDPSTAPPTRDPLLALSPPPNGTLFSSATAGTGFSCVRNHATLTGPAVTLCWGSNGDGRLGNGTISGSLTPRAISPNPGFVVVEAGAMSGCGIQSSGSATSFPPGPVWCWGDGPFGQLGNGTTGRSLSPTPVLGGIKFASISVGEYHICGLDGLGVAYCWGRGVDGQIGNNQRLNQTRPTPVITGIKWKQIVAGGFHTCGIRASDAAVYCWGSNYWGQLGTGDRSPRLTPTTSAGNQFRLLVAGLYHTCGTRGLTSPFVLEDLAWCWGGDEFGQTGTNTSYGPFAELLLTRPTQVKQGRQYRYMTAGTYHTCGALRSNGQLFCWGRGTNGQLGNSTFVDRKEPIAVYGPLFVQNVSGGFDHTIAQETSGRIVSWGFNNAGQLGNGTTNTSSIPTPLYP
jgi:alpha-tubulin suppressor-like RCC1 family protein